METIISYGGLFVILVGAWLCRKERVFIALATALASLFAAAIALRYWWLLVTLVSSLMTFPPAELCFGCYWVLFGFLYYVFLRLKDSPDERDIPLYPPLADRVLAPLFMAVPICIFVCSLMASLQISLSEAFPTYKPSDMPIPWDRAMINVYQAAEQKICGIPASDPGHTRFPKASIPHDAPKEPLWE